MPNCRPHRPPWRIPLWCAPLLLAALAAQAREQWEFQFLLTPDGVPLTEVRALAEDAEGRIWAATWGSGVARIGASEWLALNEQTGLAGNWTRGVAVGRDGAVWISTADGLSLYRNGILDSYTTASLPGLPSNNLDQIHATAGGDIILGTREGQVLLLPGASDGADAALAAPERWITVMEASSGVENRLADLLERRDGAIWISTRAGETYAIEDGALAALPAPSGALYLAESDTGQCWAADWYGYRLFALDGDAWPVVARAPDLLTELLLHENGQVYAGTRRGLFLLGQHGFEPVDLGKSVGQPYVNVLHVSPDGALWIGTQEGLVRGALRTWQHFPASHAGEDLIALAHDPRNPGFLLAIDAANGVNRFDGWGWEPVLRLDAGETLGGFHTRAPEPHLWAFGRSHLYKFSLEDGARLLQEPLPPQNSPWTERRIFQTSGGETWVLNDTGVHAFAGGAWAPRPDFDGYRRRAAYAAVEPEPGVVFVGVAGGLERWDSGGVRLYGDTDGFTERDAANAIRLARNGSLWLGTYGAGVYVFDGDTFRSHTEQDGLAHHSVSDVLEARDGTVWIAYRRSGLGNYRDGRWLNFGAQTGLPSDAILGLFEDADGQIWIQSRTSGVYRYRPDPTPPNTQVVGATLEVPAGGFGVFTFSAADGWQVTPAHALLYSWRLIGLDSDSPPGPWSPFSARSTVVTPALAPGAYRIEARASDDARNIDPTPAAIEFAVSPPLYLEPGVLVPAGLLLALVLFAFGLRVRANMALRHSRAALLQSNRQLMKEIRERLVAEQRLNEHFEQLEDLVRGRTAELEAAQRALVQQERLALLGKITASVSHELRNPLGTLRSTLFSIGRKVQDLPVDLAEPLARADRSIRRCDRIIEEFLDFTRTVSPERQLVDMDAWLEGVLQEMEIPDAVDCRYTFESGAALEVDPERLRRAVLNIVTNAIQAMEERGDPYRRLRIKSRRRDGRHEIVVKDNGAGMTEESLARIFEPLYSTKGFGVGLGVSIVQDTMKKHGGGVEYHSVLGKGTTAVLWLPLEVAED
ncbi:MAG: ATP-binding protein [Candidatus Hydrogenedentes bacterium]|nr:ATP-binding protein [Candidatus Hydrogenedentota bacterium]